MTNYKPKCQMCGETKGVIHVPMKDGTNIYHCPSCLDELKNKRRKNDN
jgi:ribosome-binding protein aMBF1 (putative translation factor)